MNATREMHGLSRGAGGKRTKLHGTWLNMRNRCNNPRAQDYAYYGGRGIVVCPRWDTFVNFAVDMGEPPTPEHTIERENSDGNYEPGNCYWATREEQSLNRAYTRIQPEDRAAIKAVYAKGNVTQAQLAAVYGVDQVRISQILRALQ